MLRNFLNHYNGFLYKKIRSYT